MLFILELGLVSFCLNNSESHRTFSSMCIGIVSALQLSEVKGARRLDTFQPQGDTKPSVRWERKDSHSHECRLSSFSHMCAAHNPVEVCVPPPKGALEKEGGRAKKKGWWQRGTRSLSSQPRASCLGGCRCTGETTTLWLLIGCQLTTSWYNHAV